MKESVSLPNQDVEFLDEYAASNAPGTATNMSAATPGRSGVLVTGLYGAGKSSVVEEISSVLEDTGVPFGALDLDWLWWFGIPGLDRAEARNILFRNLTSIAHTYLAAGVTHFVMAWSLQDPDDLGDLRAALPFPVLVVELTVPLSVIEERLGLAVTAGRADDLEEARRRHAAGIGVGLGDVQIDGDRPVSTVAGDVLDWLGWW